MSQSASNRCRFKRQLTQAVCILLTSLTTSVVWAEPGVIEILGPNGESVLAKPAPKRYGPVTPADTLWRIATASRPDESVTIYQTMYAFYVKNPQAFEQANIHKLSKNSYLVVPTIDEIRQYSDRQAMAQLRQDNESKLDAKPQSVPVTESTVTATTTPQILTPPLQESSAGTTPEIASPMAATGTSDQSMATSEEETQERFEQERARKIDEAQMGQLKNDLADSIGSIEALLNQNQALTQRVGIQ